MGYNYDKVLGPYTHNTGALKGRKFVIVFRNGKKTQTLYSRFKMQCHLDKELPKNQTVDHIDRDPTNDSLDNLRVIDRRTHASIDARRVKEVEFVCPMCNESFCTTNLQDVRGNRKKGKAGPFCGKSCAGRYGALIGCGKIEPFEVKDPYSEEFKSEYYKKER